MAPYLSLLRNNNNNKNKLNNNNNQIQENQQTIQQTTTINLDSFFPNSPLTLNLNKQSNSSNQQPKEELEEEGNSILNLTKLNEDESYLNLLNNFEQPSFLFNDDEQEEEELSNYSIKSKDIQTIIQDESISIEVNQELNSIELIQVETTSTSKLILDEPSLPNKPQLESNGKVESILEQDESIIIPPQITLSSNSKGKGRAIEADIDTMDPPTFSLDVAPIIEETILKSSKSNRPRPSLAPLPKPVILSSSTIVQTISEPIIKSVPVVTVNKNVRKYVLPSNHPSHPRRLSVLPEAKITKERVVTKVVEPMVKKSYLKRSAPISTNETVVPPTTKSKSSTSSLSSHTQSHSQTRPQLELNLNPLHVSAQKSSTGNKPSTSTESLHLQHHYSPTVTFALAPPSFSPILPSISAFSPVQDQLGDDSMESVMAMSWNEIGKMTSTPRFERVIKPRKVDPRTSEALPKKPLPRRSEIVSIKREEDAFVQPLSQTSRRASRAFGESSIKEYQPIASTSTSIYSTNLNSNATTAPPRPLESSTNRRSSVATSRPILESSTNRQNLESSNNRRASRAFNSPPSKKARHSILPSIPEPLLSSNAYSNIIPQPQPKVNSSKIVPAASSMPTEKSKSKAKLVGLTLPTDFGFESRGAEREEERKRRVAERERQRAEKDKENELSKKRKVISSWAKPDSEFKKSKTSSNETLLPSSLSTSQTTNRPPPRSRASQISSNRRRSSVYNDHSKLTSSSTTTELTKEALAATKLDQKTDLKKKVSKYLETVVMGALIEEDENQFDQSNEVISNLPLTRFPITNSCSAPITNHRPTTTISAFTFSSRPARLPLPPTTTTSTINSHSIDEMNRKRKSIQEFEQKGLKMQESKRKEAEAASRVGLKNLRNSLSSKTRPFNNVK